MKQKIGLSFEIRYLGMFKLFFMFVSCSLGMSLLISHVFALVFVVF